MDVKSYSELIKIENFIDRFNYAKLNGYGIKDLDYNRILKQSLYSLKQWRDLRRRVIIRDNGCDLGHPNRPIQGPIYIHHLNPIEAEDILKYSYKIFNMDNLVCVSKQTHEAIHYGDENLLVKDYIERSLNDTCLWR